MTKRPPKPLEQAFDKLGEMPVPSLRQAFDKLGEMPVPSLRQAFGAVMTKRPPKPLELDKLGEKPGPSLRQAFDRLRAKPEKDDLRQAFEIDLTPREPPPLPTKPPPKRMRKKGAGHPPALTDDQITRGREIFRDLLRENPKLRKAKRIKQVRQVRKALKLGRQVSDDTYLRHIIRPVVGRKHNKAQ